MNVLATVEAVESLYQGEVDAGASILDLRDGLAVRQDAVEHPFESVFRHLAREA